jgi:hypothetical protein
VSSAAQDLPGEIRESGARLVPMLAAFEGVCLDVGRQLGDALPGLNGAAQSLSEIAAALDGVQMTAATRDLEAILAGLNGATAALDDESQSLRSLGKVVREIGPQARKTQSLVRSVSALVFTLKIESAQLPEQSEEMIAFARTLQDLAEKVRDALDVYVALQVRLSGSLRHSLHAHDDFQRRHRDALQTIATEIAESLDAIASRRATAAAGLREIGEVTQEIGGRIGGCVVGCQIGDTTRQRVEHVSAALAMAADALATGGADGEHFAARVVELQRKQAEDVYAEFSRETDKVADALVALCERTLDLEARSQRVFGLDEGADGSFLHALAGKLAAARTLVSAGLSARRDVDDAKRAAAAAMAEMKASNASLEEAAANVTMIGTNASLRSARLGEAGKGITLVAAELRSFGRMMRSGVYQLSETLGRALEGVDRFSLAETELDADRMGELEQRMVQAIEVFGGSGRQIREAQERLTIGAGGAQDKLDLGRRALGARVDAKRALTEALDALGRWSRSLQGGREPDEAVDRLIAERLRPSYSMAQERRVHDRFAGLPEEAPEAAPVEAAEEADAFLL